VHKAGSEFFLAVSPSAFEIFFSAKLRLARAEEHFNDLKTQIDIFFAEKPYTRIAEPDADGVHETHKLRPISVSLTENLFRVGINYKFSF
jgi:hypothetical protein